MTHTHTPQTGPAPALQRSASLVLGTLVLAALSAPAQADPVVRTDVAPAVSKDVLLDRAPAAPAETAVPTTAIPTAVVTATPATAPNASASAQRMALLAAALGDLGATLMSAEPQPKPNKGPGNAVVSPLSVAAALGLLQAAAKGQTAQELTYVLDSGSSRGQRLTQDLPALLSSLRGANTQTADAPFQIANRVWVDQRIAENIAPAFVSKSRQHWGADGALVPFAQAEPTRALINQWVATQTRQQIKEILPPGSISGNTRFVVTNAVHFKAAWQQPFDAALTQARPFKPEAKAPVMVPTMESTRALRQASLPSGETVYELPFKGAAFSMLLVLPPVGSALQALEQDLNGADWANYTARLEPKKCVFQIPKFKLSASVGSLKATLRAMGVQQPFADGADFSEMLGKNAAAKLDDVFHSASFEIDETGGEASAATAAVAVAKSFGKPEAECTVDRPFVFALMHKASGAPLFVGRVVDPTQP